MITLIRQAGPKKQDIICCATSHEIKCDRCGLAYNGCGNAGFPCKGCGFIMDTYSSASIYQRGKGAYVPNKIKATGKIGGMR
jgi:tRNA(Ile2) C34 agmatinyltransferase TiaS